MVLVPEKRFDKNGVLTTKHVRAGGITLSPTTAMPAPVLTQQPSRERKYKVPTQKQKKLYRRSYVLHDQRRTPELTDALGVDTVAYRFDASDADMFQMLAVTAYNGDALSLLECGYRSPEAAVDFLLSSGFGHLVTDRSIAMEAMERNVTPEIFLRDTRNMTEEQLANPLLVDSLVAASMVSLNDQFTWEVREGMIKLSDIKAIGAARIKKADSWALLTDVLKKMSTGNTNYTAQNLAVILDKYSPVTNRIESAVLLADAYGGDFAQKIKNVDMATVDMHFSLQGDDLPLERAKSLLSYASEVFSEFNGIYGYSSDYPDKDKIIRFHDANVSPKDMADGVITLEQLDAIRDHGISPSVSGGWL